MKKSLLSMGLFLPITSLSVSTTSCFLKKPTTVPETEELIDNKFSLRKSNIKFKDIAGYKNEKDKLNEAIDIIKNPQKYAKNNIFPPKGILFEGEPGTGKSFLAKAFAGETDLSYLFLSGSEFENKYFGVGADTMRKAFSIARNHNKQCIIIIDEIDSIGRKRNSNSIKDHSSPLTLNQLLKEMTDEANNNVILIGTTNLISELDPALIRTGRCDIKLSFKSTSKKDRKEIFKLYAEKIEAIKKANLDYDYIAEISEKMVASDIKLVVDNVATRIIQSKQTANIIEIFDEEIETNKYGIKSDINRTDAELETTAYLQSAKALVAIKTNYSEVKKISISPRGENFGFVEINHVQKTVKQIKNAITVFLAGTAYEKLKTGGEDNMSVEETKNRKEAQKFLTKLSDDFQMNPLPIGFYDQLLKDAKNILNTNKTVLDQLAKELLNKKTLNKEEILKIVK